MQYPALQAVLREFVHELLKRDQGMGGGLVISFISEYCQG